MYSLLVLVPLLGAVAAALNDTSIASMLLTDPFRYYQKLQLQAAAAARTNPGRYDSGRYDAGRYDPTKYNTGQYDPSKFNGQGKYISDRSGTYGGDRGSAGEAYNGGYGDRGDRGGPGGAYDGDRGDSGERGGPGALYSLGDSKISVGNTVEIVQPTTLAPTTTPVPTSPPNVAQYYDYIYAINGENYEVFSNQPIPVNDQDDVITGKGFFDYSRLDNYVYRTDYIADGRLYY